MMAKRCLKNQQATAKNVFIYRDLSQALQIAPIDFKQLITNLDGSEKCLNNTAFAYSCSSDNSYFFSWSNAKRKTLENQRELKTMLGLDVSESIISVARQVSGEGFVSNREDASVSREA
ncbi:hypothetical protein L204_104241 [Cryptococcus depauperatus]